MAVMSAQFTGTITVGRQAHDRFGDPSGDMTKHTIPGCIIYPTTSTESENLSDTIVTGQGVLPPVGSDIAAADFVWLPGDDLDSAPPWQVTGDAGTYISPFSGWAPGMQVELHRYKG